MKPCAYVCVYCLLLTNHVLFQPKHDHYQTAKDIDPYFKSQLDVEDPGHRKPVLIFPEWAELPRSTCEAALECMDAYNVI